jgi:hypothetical protein
MHSVRPIASVNSISTPDSIGDLLRLARVPPSNKKAAAWLKDAIASARSSYEVAERRPLPANHNALLADIEKSAQDLRQRIHRLRQHPVSWHAFWHARAFGPVRADRHEIPEVASILARVEKAAAASKDFSRGRRREAGKQHVVDRAFGFFVRFSPLEPSGTATGAFAQFARDFYSTVTGADPEEHRGLDRQIRQTVKRLPIERKRLRAQQKPVK